MPEEPAVETLTPKQWASLRAFADIAPEVVAEWPRVKAAAARKSFTDWITGVLARNPKLSNAVTMLLTLALGAATMWLTGLLNPAPKPAPEAVVVPAPAEPRPVMPPATKASSKASPGAVAQRPAPSFTEALRAAYDAEPAEDKEILHHLKDVYSNVLGRIDGFETGLQVRESTDAMVRLLGGRLVRVQSAISAEMAATLPTGTLDGAGRARASEVMARIVDALGMIVGDRKAVQAVEPVAVEKTEPAGLVTYRSLGTGYGLASEPQPNAKLNASERKVK